MAAVRNAALGLAALLVLVAWSSAWFEITATGTYVEGLDREPTIRTQYSIDLSLIHISEPTRLRRIADAGFGL